MASGINLPKLTLSLLNIISSCEQLGSPLTYNGLLLGITYMLGAGPAVQLVKSIRETGLIRTENGLIYMTALGHKFRATPDILERLKGDE